MLVLVTLGSGFDEVNIYLDCEQTNGGKDSVTGVRDSASLLLTPKGNTNFYFRS